jgi:hypothetical protein
LLWIVAVLAVAACSGDAPEGTSGSLSLELTLVDGTEIDAVHWKITGDEMRPMRGMIDIRASGTTGSVEVFGLPPDDGYEIEMEATSTDGQTSCEGAAGFDVEADKVTELAVMLHCKGPERLGGVRVNGKVNTCAELTKVVVSPLETSVGSDIDLSADASDADGHEVSYEWTATGGALDEPTASQTIYTCTHPGQHAIRIAVSDGEPCLEDWTVQVTCTDAGGGTGGSAGFGGAGGAGGAGSDFPCSEEGIRAAIAAGGGPHTFDCDGPTIVVTGSEIEIDTDVILDGGSELEVNGDDEHRVFSVPLNVTAELRGLRITGGATTGEGAGIHNYGDLTLIDATVSRNFAHHDYDILLGGGVTGNGGGIANRGTLTLIECTVSENTAKHGEEILKDARATGDGGGIHNRGSLALVDTIVTGNAASDGGGIFNMGTANLTGSTFSHNTAFIVRGLGTHGGGLSISPNGSAELDNCTIRNNGENGRLGLAGGGLYVEGTALIKDSVLTSNVAQLGGGLYSKGGFVTLQTSTVSGHDMQQGAGLENFGGVMILESSTVSGNTASGVGGGILSHGDLQGVPPGTLILVNSTVSGNAAGNSGGGIGNHRSQLILISSTVAQNQGGRDILNSDPSSRSVNSIIQGKCTGQERLLSDGGNVESPGNTCGFAGEADQVMVTPEQLALEPLSDNGGPTLTHALGVGSVAIDRAPQEECLDLYQMPLLTDQRGAERPQGPACDSGAIELQPLD